MGRRLLSLLAPTRMYMAPFYALVNRIFFMELVFKTNNFADTRWLGQPIWQNTFDLWLIQEAIWEIKPALIIETGTHHGGSARFYAHLLDLIGAGRVVTIDTAKRDVIPHPRIEFVDGSSTSEEVVNRVRKVVDSAPGPVMVILDSDHSAPHVRRELELYARFVTPGSFLLVQDGIIDRMFIFRHGRPGPLPAIRDFLAEHHEFTVETARSERFVISHHPMGWLRRRLTTQS
jgi:cephalosporin hydroxylase